MIEICAFKKKTREGKPQLGVQWKVSMLDGPSKIPNLVALGKFQTWWLMGKHFAWWHMEGSSAWWPLEGFNAWWPLQEGSKLDSL
jgi:hypothetical protein